MIPFSQTKLYHRGSLIDNKGNVSALCYAKPKAINLKQALWTNRDEAVTCPKCLAILKAKNK